MKTDIEKRTMHVAKNVMKLIMCRYTNKKGIQLDLNFGFMDLLTT